MEMGKACSQTRETSLDACSNHMGSTEGIKETRYISNDMDERHDEISRKHMEQKSEEQGQLKEIHYAL